MCVQHSASTPEVSHGYVWGTLILDLREPPCVVQTRMTDGELCWSGWEGSSRPANTECAHSGCSRPVKVPGVWEREVSRARSGALQMLSASQHVEQSTLHPHHHLL